MILPPPVHLPVRLHSPDSKWELVLRYAAATATTLLAIAGAQLVITPNSFIWILTILTLLGVPVSLRLRQSELRAGNFVIPRPVLNSLTVILSLGASIYFVVLPMSDFFLPLLSGSVPSSFWMHFGGGEPVQALMQLFLLFAAFRSFSIVSDKDATLTTVPSFSVLLLLIPVHKGIEVVVYFVAWTFVAATLFALDHRSEVRTTVSATVPAIVAGQDVRLGARSLAMILVVSLACAIGVSLVAASRNPEDRSATESAVTALAARITNLVLSLPETSVNSGPERQIDFKTGPTLPSRAPLWQVRAEEANFDREPVRPTYWRMFALSNYNGVSWTQGEVKLARVSREELDQTSWPIPQMGRDFGWNSRRFRRFGVGGPNFFRNPPVGYDVKGSNPGFAQQSSQTSRLVRQTLTSLVPNLGFVPVQPAVRSVRIESEQKEIRVRSDGAIDVGVVQINQGLRILSEVPPLPEYGIANFRLPSRRLGAAEIAASGVVISARERALNLRLPPTLPYRVRELSAKMLGRIPQDASNSVKAQRIALAIQENATYTLRPPTIPEGRDATDFFLFDGGRRGYCTYFAGALTVLCRAQGIPARVVSGFGGIEWEGPEAGLLREGNAHAWTEIWVDGFGWAVVDATPPSERGDNSPTWLESWGDWAYSGLSDSTFWISGRKGIVGALVLALCALFIVRSAQRGRFPGWNRPSGRDDDFERRGVAKIYRNTARAMSRRFRPKSAWETPDEWLQSCAKNLCRADFEALNRLTALYLSARYGARPLPSGSAKLARETAASIGWKKVKAVENANAVS